MKAIVTVQYVDQDGGVIKTTVDVVTASSASYEADMVAGKIINTLESGE